MYQRCLKRVFDVLLCSMALVVLSPVFLFVAIGIKVSSKGPVFYHSLRAGKDKKVFHFYKFRSMHLTNHDKGMFVADAQRVFPFGSLIRKLKLDELPQLLNVIQGHMSIVGPRPMTADGVDLLYTGRYLPVSSIRPGLTSAASLYDYTVGDSVTDNNEYIRTVLPIKLEMELMYVENRSFTYDVSLILRTIKIILLKVKGAKSFTREPELTQAEARLNAANKKYEP